jgi:hypothetical protein
MLHVMTEYSVQEMINVLMELVKDLEDAFVEMAMFLLLWKIVNLLELDVVIQLVTLEHQPLCVDLLEEFVMVRNLFLI